MVRGRTLAPGRSKWLMEEEEEEEEEDFEEGDAESGTDAAAAAAPAGRASQRASASASQRASPSASASASASASPTPRASVSASQRASLGQSQRASAGASPAQQLAPTVASKRLSKAKHSSERVLEEAPAARSEAALAEASSYSAGPGREAGQDEAADTMVLREAASEQALCVRAAHVVLSEAVGVSDPYDPSDVGRNRERLAWRVTFFSWKMRWTLKLSAVALLLLGMFDNLFTCSPTAAFATNCTEQHDSLALIGSEAAILAVVTAGAAMQVEYKRWALVRRDPWLVLLLTQLVVSWVTITFNAAFTTADLQKHLGRGVWGVRASMRPMPLLYLNFKVRTLVLQMFRLIPRVVAIFVLMMLVVFLFALYGRLMSIDPDMPGNDFGLPGNGFESLGAAFVTCYWWAFTTNGPEPGNNTGAPGYKGGAMWAVFWTFYSFIQVLYLGNLITALVFSKYLKMAQQDQEAGEQREREAIARAFEMLCGEPDAGAGAGAKAAPSATAGATAGADTAAPAAAGAGTVPYERAEKLVRFLVPLEVRGRTAWRPLEPGRALDLQAFQALLFRRKSLLKEVDAITREAHDSEKVRQRRLAEAAGGGRALRSKIRLLLLSNRVAGFFYLVTLVNAILMGVFGEQLMQLNAQNTVTFTAVTGFLLLFTILFLLDWFLALLSYGPRGVLTIRLCALKARFFVTCAILIIIIPQYTQHGSAGSFFVSLSTMWLMHLPASLAAFPPLRAILKTMALVAPGMTNVVLANLCVMYTFSVWGVCMIGGKFVTTDQELQNFNGGTMFSSKCGSAGRRQPITLTTFSSLLAAVFPSLFLVLLIFPPLSLVLLLLLLHLRPLLP
jgi:hypothetical protein